MTILIFLAVLLVLIIVHEFGHFIVAKRSGIRVDEFGIGFPPKLFGKKFGETEYTLNALPFGGFVRIFGENPEDVADDSARALIHKPKLTQAAVMFAGVFFNVLLAFVIFSTTFMAGTPAAGGVYADKYFSGEELLITNVLANSPAESAGLQPGDAIRSLSAEGSFVETRRAEDVAQFVSAHPDTPIELSYVRADGAEERALITPQTGFLEENPSAPAIGVAMGLLGEVKLPPHLAVWEGLKKTGEMLYRVTIGLSTFIGSALILNADLSNIAGPVGIVDLVGDASALGLVALLNFTAFISLNLAIINLIPFPALDGGRLLFLAIEAVKGSPIPPKAAQMTNVVGFALLILLMLIVTYNDILRIVS